MKKNTTGNYSFASCRIIVKTQVKVSRYFLRYFLKVKTSNRVATVELVEAVNRIAGPFVRHRAHALCTSLLSAISPVHDEIEMVTKWPLPFVHSATCKSRFALR